MTMHEKSVAYGLLTKQVIHWFGRAVSLLLRYPSILHFSGTATDPPGFCPFALLVQEGRNKEQTCDWDTSFLFDLDCSQLNPITL